MVSQPKIGPIPSKVLPLEPGDRLTRAEFERRYQAMPQVKKAELIEGVVQMPSPVRADQHGNPHADIIWWLKHYSVFTPGVRVSDNATVRLDMDNEPQPDALIYRQPSHGGRVVIDPDGYIEGAPELLAEIAASTVSIDMQAKLRVYRRNQVQEYIVWRVEDRAVDWFLLREGEYVSLSLNSAGIYQSEEFPGLWLDPEALVRADSSRVLRVLEEGLTSPGHVAFVAKLQEAETQAKQGGSSG